MSKIKIAESEIPIMRVIWEGGGQSLPDILNKLSGNKNTNKTLLSRLVAKGAVRVTKETARNGIYSAVISEADYIKGERKGFLNRAFDGSKERLLLNFVKEENVTKEELLRLLELVEEE